MAVEPPRPGTLSADKLCELTGLTDRRHRQLAKDGCFPPPYKGQYDASLTIAGLFKYFREQLARKDDRERQAAIRYKEGKAKTIEKEYEILDNKYVPKDQIKPALRNVALHQRAILQRKLESELAPNLAGLKTPEIRKRMAAAVDEICAVFRDGVRSWMDAEP